MQPTANKFKDKVDDVKKDHYTHSHNFLSKSYKGSGG